MRAAGIIVPLKDGQYNNRKVPKQIQYSRVYTQTKNDCHTIHYQLFFCNLFCTRSFHACNNSSQFKSFFEHNKKKKILLLLLILIVPQLTVQNTNQCQTMIPLFLRIPVVVCASISLMPGLLLEGNQANICQSTSKEIWIIGPQFLPNAKNNLGWSPQKFPLSVWQRIGLSRNEYWFSSKTAMKITSTSKINSTVRTTNQEPPLQLITILVMSASTTTLDDMIEFQHSQLCLMVPLRDQLLVFVYRNWCLEIFFF